MFLKFNKDQSDALAWLSAKRAALTVAETATTAAAAQKLLRKHAEHKVVHGHMRFAPLPSGLPGPAPGAVQRTHQGSGRAS